MQEKNKVTMPEKSNRADTERNPPTWEEIAASPELANALFAALAITRPYGDN